MYYILCLMICIRDSIYNLREFALCYERHPESMRTVPWLRPAGRDSAPRTSADVRGRPLACSNPRSQHRDLDVSTSGKFAWFVDLTYGFRIFKTVEKRVSIC